jgi:uncharacterized protein (DUF3084 family)
LASPTVIDDITPAEPQTTSELETLRAQLEIVQNENARLRLELFNALQAEGKLQAVLQNIRNMSSILSY